jgi:hypothetical protein
MPIDEVIFGIADVLILLYTAYKIIHFELYSDRYYM